MDVLIYWFTAGTVGFFIIQFTAQIKYGNHGNLRNFWLGSVFGYITLGLSILIILDYALEYKRTIKQID